MLHKQQSHVDGTFVEKSNLISHWNGGMRSNTFAAE